MKIEYYQLNSFTDTDLHGNPAGVCLLDEWLNDEKMQFIAAENNLSETAFVVKEGPGKYHIRWFTPAIEVDLCGHATLASASVIFNYTAENEKQLVFNSRSGILTVTQHQDIYAMDFPADKLVPVTEKHSFLQAFREQPIEIYKGKTDYVLIYRTEEEVKNMKPAFSFLTGLKERGVIVTAKGNQVDFVSRFFAPQAGIPEDPVTGSAHTSLTPYWSEKLGKDELIGQQLSQRGGKVYCQNRGERIIVSGKVTLYSSGYIHIPV